MCSQGTVHSIGGKGTGCCWSDPSCTIAAVPGPALDPQAFSRGKSTVTDRPHCESCNNGTRSCNHGNVLDDKQHNNITTTCARFLIIPSWVGF